MLTLMEILQVFFFFKLKMASVVRMPKKIYAIQFSSKESNHS